MPLAYHARRRTTTTAPPCRSPPVSPAKTTTAPGASDWACTSDKIGSHQRRHAARDASNHTSSPLGVTQALDADRSGAGRRDLQRRPRLLLRPYKELDNRPPEREQGHPAGALEPPLRGRRGATLRRAIATTATISASGPTRWALEWVQPVRAVFTLTPSLRLYTPERGPLLLRPVYDPDVGAPIPPGYFQTRHNTFRPTSGCRRSGRSPGPEARARLIARLDRRT